MKVQIFILGVGIPSDQADAIRLAAQAGVNQRDQLESKVLTVRNWTEAKNAMSEYTDIAPMLIIPFKDTISGDGFIDFLSLLSQRRWDLRALYVSLGLAAPKAEVERLIARDILIRQDRDPRIADPIATTVAERFYLAGTTDEEIPPFTYVPEDDALVDSILEQGLGTDAGPSPLAVAEANKQLDPNPKNNYIWWILGGVAVAGLAFLIIKNRRRGPQVIRPDRRALPFTTRAPRTIDIAQDLPLLGD